MRIVFDEVQGAVVNGPQADANPRPEGAPALTPAPPDPTSIARALRVLSQRKARLLAD